MDNYNKEHQLEHFTFTSQVMTNWFLLFPLYDEKQRFYIRKQIIFTFFLNSCNWPNKTHHDNKQWLLYSRINIEDEKIHMIYTSRVKVHVSEYYSVRSQKVGNISFLSPFSIFVLLGSLQEFIWLNENMGPARSFNSTGAWHDPESTAANQECWWFFWGKNAGNKVSVSRAASLGVFWPDDISNLVWWSKVFDSEGAFQRVGDILVVEQGMLGSPFYFPCQSQQCLATRSQELSMAGFFLKSSWFPLRRMAAVGVGAAAGWTAY